MRKRRKTTSRGRWEGHVIQKCAVDGCEEKAKGKGYCRSHYMKWRRHGDPVAGRQKKSTPPGEQAKWLESHRLYDGSECLIWPYRKMWNGRGVTFHDGKTTFAHRVMCKLRNGPPPSEKHEAAHSCGNGHIACVNPNHLRWATRKENEADKVKHGTRLVGTQLTWTKLTEADVLAIRDSLEKRDCRRSVLCERYGVVYSTLRRIELRQIWGWL